jgi:hypothetical protein
MLRRRVRLAPPLLLQTNVLDEEVAPGEEDDTLPPWDPDELGLEGEEDEEEEEEEEDAGRLPVGIVEKERKTVWAPVRDIMFGVWAAGGRPAERVAGQRGALRWELGMCAPVLGELYSWGSCVWHAKAWGAGARCTTLAAPVSWRQPAACGHPSNAPGLHGHPSREWSVPHP